MRAALAAGVGPALLQAREVVGVLPGDAGINVDFALAAGLAVHDAEIAVLRRIRVVAGEQLNDEQRRRTVAQRFERMRRGVEKAITGDFG